MMQKTRRILKTAEYFLTFARQSYSLLGYRDLFRFVLGFFIRIRFGVYKVDYKGVPLGIRRGTQDVFVFLNVFANKCHRPMTDLPEGGTIIDLGSNVGYSVVDYAMLYPRCRVIGVEMDRNNFDLALINTSHFSNITMINRAISVTDNTVVSYRSGESEDAFHISNGPESESSTILVHTISIGTLMETNEITLADYVKMDIEGEEGHILSNSDLSWLSKVKRIQIELHPHLNPLATTELATAVLEDHGFTVTKSAIHDRAIFAINRNIM